jgi:hypothetical protein
MTICVIKKMIFTTILIMMIYMAIIEINVEWEIQIKSSILIKAAIYYS